MASKTLNFPYQPELPYPFLLHTPNGPAIFIHIPKTGGTSVHRAFKLPRPKQSEFFIKHYTVDAIKNHLPADLWNKAYKFAFVRNPYERLYSHYQYRNKRKKILLRLGEQLSFNDWVKVVFNDSKTRNIQPQHQWIYNREGELAVDFLGRFEQLSPDFQKVCQHLGLSSITLPHLNKSSQQGEYLKQYDEESLAITTDFYREDFRFFNYKPLL